MPLLFAEDNKLSDNMINGREWNSWSDHNKVQYVIGFIDGAYALDEVASSRFSSTALHRLITSATIGEVTEEMDTLYKEGANLNVPIWYMMIYCHRVLKGENTQASNEAALIQLRKRANKMEIK